MKSILTLVAILSLTACGVDTASTAATAAAVKKQEIEQGKQTMDQVQKNLEQANQQATDRLEKAGETAK